ncbi:MAG: PQQ-binding-like beta-propeller repeat protein, partial [Planctomycetota bacterium]
HRLRIGEPRATDRLRADVLPSIVKATARTVDREASRRAPNAWLAAGGDAQHRAAAPGDVPTPWRQWRAEIAADDPLASVAAATSAQTTRLPAGQAIAVAGVIVTPTRDGLIAFSATSGKRLWVIDTPEDTERLVPSHGSLSTDTRLLFAVVPSNPSQADLTQSTATPSVDAFFDSSSNTTPTNRLAAYELATGGKLRWQLDGGDPTSPAAGARFVGAPARIDSRLYAIAEREQSMVLFEIDANTGRIDWTQTLVHRERDRGGWEDEPAVTPTIHDGIVYCPTGLGAIVAVEPLRRRIEWINYLGVDEGASRPDRGQAWRGGRFDRRAWVEEPEGWRHCRVIVSDGRLVIASPAEASLQAFDSATGTRLWRHEAESGVALGTVADGLAVVVEADTVSAWRLADGEPAWSVPLPEGSRPAGEGVLFDSRFVVPLSSGRLAAVTFDRAERATIDLIDLATNRLSAPPSLGNLFYHAGAILSRSYGVLESYPQAGVPPDQQEAALAALGDGDVDTAITLLREALDARPGDRQVAEQLAAALVRSVDGDPNQAARVGREVGGLVTGPKATAYAAMLRLRAAKATNADRLQREAAALLAGPAADVVLQPEVGLRIKASRLAAGRLEALSSRDTPYDAVPPAGLFDNEWSLHQVAVQVNTEPKPVATGRTRRTRSDRGQKPRRVLLPVDLSNRQPGHWTIETRDDGTEVLVGSNTHGERAFAEELPGDYSANGKGVRSVFAVPGHRAWHQWLALKLDNGFAVYHFDAKTAGEAWTTDDLSATPTQQELLTSGTKEAPIAVGPWGVVSLAGSTWVCRDLVTGEPLWRRELPDGVDPSARVLTCGDQLLLVDRSERCWRYAAWTGELLSDNERLTAPKRWRAGADGRLLVEERGVGGRRFRILDPAAADADRVLWEQAVPTTTRVLVVDRLAALLSENLELTVIDIADATERFRVTLPGPSEPLVRAFRITERRERLLVEIDRSNPMVDRARGETPLGSKPLLTGELHCLDARTGDPLWASSAQIDGMAVLDNAATDAPVILLGNRKAPESEGEQAEATIALVVLDLASGGTLYRNDQLPAGTERSTESLVWDQYESTAGGKHLLIRAGRSWVSLQTTDAPAPPRVPMIARIEHPRPSDLQDMGRNVELFFKSFLNDEE